MKAPNHIHPLAAARPRSRAFTLIELVASMTILSLLMLACVTAVDSVRRSVTQVRGKSEQFREARLAFDLITTTLSQATLNTYWDYYYQGTASNTAPAGTTTPPTAYVRYSELQFQTGPTTTLLGGQTQAAEYPGHALFFQAPLGLTHSTDEGGSLLNARGYAIQFSSDDNNRPPFFSEHAIPVHRRYRLIEYRPPSERTTDYQGNAIYSKPADWFRQDFATSTRIVADNIVLLVISPKVGDRQAAELKKSPTWIAPNYIYNSRDTDNATEKIDNLTVQSDGTVQQGTQHLLPPLVQVTMVALDELSAQTFAEKHGDQPVDLLDLAAAPFTTAQNYDDDLAALQTYLDTARLNYQVFTTTIPLRNAKWDSRTF